MVLRQDEGLTSNTVASHEQNRNPKLCFKGKNFVQQFQRRNTYRSSLMKHNRYNLLVTK